MNFATPKSKVYIQADYQGRILHCEGGYTIPDDLTEWIEIDEGAGDRYNLCQSCYFDGGLYTTDGIPRYRWDGSTAVLRTDEELNTDRMLIIVAKTRAQRDKMLAETDWTQTLDAPLTADEQNAYRIYRQALRDIPQQENFPASIVWPEIPVT